MDRLLPESIREYFFFDGERLDDYFKEEAGQRIKAAVFEISQIALLAAVERKLADMIKDLEREAAAKAPGTEALQEKLDKAEQQQDGRRKDLEACLTELATAEVQAADYLEKLRGLPDVEALEEERENLGKQLDVMKETVAAKEAEKAQLLYDYGVILNVQDVVSKAIGIIDEKRRQNEIPPPVNAQLLQSTLEDKRCRLCDCPLSPEAEKHVLDLQERIRSTLGSADELQKMEPYLRFLSSKASGFLCARDSANAALETSRGLQVSLQESKDKIDEDLGKYDQEMVREWSQNRKKYDSMAKQHRERKGALEAELKSAEREMEKLKTELKQQLKMGRKAKGLQEQIAFAQASLDAAHQAKIDIMTGIRVEIQKRTSQTFLDLVWKKKTYEGVEIDENYNISLNHCTGYDALGSASAAERELLALSFTLALHEISGFACPLVIDTPVARVSGANRENFGKVLVEVGSRDKQVVLLLTPEEYTANISHVLDGPSATRRRLKLLASEQENCLEDLGHGA